MADPIFWSDVQIDVGLTDATALTITAVTKENPAVVTYTGTDPVDGTFIKIQTIVGMTELKNRVFRIANVDGGANTLELEGEDSTSYRTFVSGSAVPVATTVGMTTVQDVTASGGDPEFADLTTVHDSIRRRAPTVFSPSSYSFGNFYDATDPALARLRAVTKSKTQVAIIFTFSDGTQFAFLAYASASGAPTGSAQEVVKTPATLESQGLPNAYAAA